MTGKTAANSKTLAIEVRAPRQIRAWHLGLISALREDGHRLRLIGERLAPDLPFGFALLLAFERLAYRTETAAFAAVAGDERTRPEEAFDAPDLVIALVDSAPVGNAPRLTPLFDGLPGEAAMLAALLDGHAPALALLLEDKGRAPQTVAHGLPAIEEPTVVARGLDQVTARLAVLIRGAVHRLASGERATDAATPSPAAAAASHRSAPSFLLRGLEAKIARRLTRLTKHPDHWRIGWRMVSGAGVAEDLAWPNQAYVTIPDDGRRYFADPFPLTYEDRTYLFCEEYPYATGKGVIAVFEIAADGALSAPRVVLERPYHLSYPQVFAQDGQIYMLPETCAAGRIEIYRADPFPDVWVRHAVLVDNVAASDATWIEHQGRHWLFATLAGDGGSTWDQLGLYQAPGLFGPWQPHEGNPALIDAGAARPGGAMWRSDGNLWRVAQDCRSHYGGGLALCRVDALAPDAFAQTVIARLGPPAGLSATGVHTLNRAGSIETIDWCGPQALPAHGA